jgi:DnaJ-domain-containing protein 1
VITDNFALLNVPRRPWLDTDSLKLTFFTVSAAVHPDRVHHAVAAEKRAANERYAELNAAYQCLREPRERLRHLLELELGTKPSDLTQVPEDLMDMFFAIGKEFRAVDALLVEKSNATSPLLQVQLFERGQDWVEKLGALRQTFKVRRDALLAELELLNAAWEMSAARPLERLQEIWRLLSFYERWLAQIQERVVKLSF